MYKFWASRWYPTGSLDIPDVNDLHTHTDVKFYCLDFPNSYDLTIMEEFLCHRTTPPHTWMKANNAQQLPDSGTENRNNIKKYIHVKKLVSVSLFMVEGEGWGRRLTNTI